MANGFVVQSFAMLLVSASLQLTQRCTNSGSGFFPLPQDKHAQGPQWASETEFKFVSLPAQSRPLLCGQDVP